MDPLRIPVVLAKILIVKGNGMGIAAFIPLYLGI
jgi:hypothetical protein